MFAFFEAVGADFESAAGRQNGPLEIGLFPPQAGRIVFGSADAVGVSSDQPAALVASGASFHISTVACYHILTS